MHLILCIIGYPKTSTDKDIKKMTSTLFLCPRDLGYRFAFVSLMYVLLLTLNIKDMKKLLFCIVLSIVASGVGFAQSAKELAKERKELVKAARKEAKTLLKDGWIAAPGALPLEKQLERSYQMSRDYDEDMFPKYLMGEAMSIGGNYDAAKMQALALAKQNLAGQIQTEVTALVENTVSNEQLEAEQAESITRSVMASKNLISQSIGRTISVVEVYRTLKNKNKEVLVRIAYNSNMAKKIAKKAIKEDLEKKGDDLHNKLDELLGW